MVGTTLKPDLKVPEQKTASLSFCETTPKGFSAWIDQLPMANIGEVSRQLYHAVIELNHLFISHTQRLQLLEMIRPKIHFVCAELTRHYLGVSIALPEKQRKIANLSQALQLHSASGYKLCVLECIDNGGVDRNKKAIALATHRAISELASTILRSHQLYCPSPAMSWLECHRLYRFAQRNRFHTQPVEDETLNNRSSSTVEDCYKRILLLGCARPNQLRQSELALVYGLFETWTDMVDCGSDADEESLFVVNMERDASPMYRSLLNADPGYEGLNFDTRTLSSEITDALHSRTRGEKIEDGLRLPPTVTNTLLTHLSQALGILAKRNFNRITSQGSLEICVGLSATHYFVAGAKTFNEFVTGNNVQAIEDAGNSNRFMGNPQKPDDAWAGSHDAEPTHHFAQSADTPINFKNSVGSTPDTATDRQQPKAHHALLINTSPGGYCVAWESTVPSSLQAGEVLGVREQSNHPWSIAVVRWIRQVRNHGTQIGIELLAPSAAPCGVRLIQKVGNSSEYLRGLLLPEISVVNQAATLITPRLPFQSGSRISLLYDGREDQGTLSRKVSATGSISQFELKLQNSGGAPITQPPLPGTSEDEFDSLWPSL